MKGNNMQKAMIFDIQKFCVHDGPGIRTTIFFKGCNLSCKWCHNPESLSGKKQLSYEDEKCNLCKSCVGVCQSNVHEFSSEQHKVDFSKCTGCGRCVNVCVPDALKIIGKEVSIEEIISEVEKDRHFYKESGGGVTLSGGECTVQFEFILKLLKELNKKKLHTCIETNGIIDTEKLQKLIPFVNLFLLDFKLADNKLHKFYTGSENKNLYKTLEVLDKNNAQVVLRCPIIQGINDNEEHFSEISKLCDVFLCIKDVEIMPYHSLGRDKWKHIGKEYLFEDLESASKEMQIAWKRRLMTIKR